MAIAFSSRHRHGAATAAAILALVMLTAARARPASDRGSPPPVAAPEAIALPVPVVRQLPNGLSVLVVERHSLPVLTLRLVVRAGPEADPPDLPGTAQFASALLNEGTTHRSALEIADAIDGAGGTFDSSAAWSSSYAALTVLADHATLAFDVLSDVVQHPAFEPAEVERARRQTLSALEVLHQDPSYLADTAVNQLILAGTIYGHPADGTTDAAKRLSSAVLARFHADRYTPRQSLLAVVGDISPETAFDQAAKYFGAWSGPADSPVPAAPSRAADESGEPRLLVIDKPDAVQTEIRVGLASVPRSSPDYVPLMVANQVLGGPAVNRLFSNLRAEHGLTYGASSDLNAYASAGSWVAKTSTRTAETVAALRAVLDEFHRLRERGVNTAELQQAVDYLIGHQALEFETSASVADQFLDLMTYHLNLDTWSKLPVDLRALTPAAVNQAIGRYLDPDHASIVLVGNWAAFEKDVRKYGRARVVPIDRVEFGLPDFEAPSKRPANAPTH